MAHLVQRGVFLGQNGTNRHTYFFSFYDGFYEREIELRRLRGDPPFAQHVVVTASGLEEGDGDPLLPEPLQQLLVGVGGGDGVGVHPQHLRPGEQLLELLLDPLGGEQAILFLNRRGASRMVSCGECGEVPECPRCSVKLTYRKSST